MAPISQQSLFYGCVFFPILRIYVSLATDVTTPFYQTHTPVNNNSEPYLSFSRELAKLISQLNSQYTMLLTASACTALEQNKYLSRYNLTGYLLHQEIDYYTSQV